MASLSILLTLFAIAITMTHGSPLSRRDIWTGGRLTGNNYQCHDVPESIACYCGYNVTVLPNSRGHTTVEEALGEFFHFKQLLTANPCSDYIGALLCFDYFPLHAGVGKRNCGAENTIVRPCRSTCEAAKNTACTNLITASHAGRWAPHLDCKNFPTGVCAGPESIIKKDFCSCLNISKVTEVPTTEKPTTIEISTEEATDTATTEKPTEVEVSSTEKSAETEAVSTEEPTEEESTEAPTKKSMLISCIRCDNYNCNSHSMPHFECYHLYLFPAVAQCPKKCNIRENYNGKTFIRNNYSFGEF